MSIVVAATAAVLFGIGTYLVLQRKLSRILVGLGLLTHGANVLLLTSGRRGDVPVVGSGDTDDMADPLTHALALTSIVITFGVTAFLLALAFRSWVLTRDDEVGIDPADVLVASGQLRAKEVLDEVFAEHEAVVEEQAAAETAAALGKAEL